MIPPLTLHKMVVFQPTNKGMTSLNNSIAHSYHNINCRRAAGVKIAGAGLTKRYFCSRVLYSDGMGKQKMPPIEQSYNREEKALHGHNLQREHDSGGTPPAAAAKNIIKNC